MLNHENEARSMMAVGKGLTASAALLGLLLLAACGASEIAPENRGGRGESCLARNDCKSGLACVNQRCSKNDFDIKPTAKSCDLIECENADDCCALYQSPQCSGWEEDCATGDQNSCIIYESNCACDNLDCEDNRCVQAYTCTDDTDCPSTWSCVSDRCVECGSDSDCSFSGQVCVSGQCEAGCSRNEECPLFHSCNEGKCEETGCTTDRECIAAAGDNPLALEATCKDSECLIACSNDGECGTYNICDGGVCTFIGCDNDDECRYFLGIENDDTFQAVCRE